MSLHAAAQHLSSQGRGPDNTLVHMSRGEVKGLQDLAMAHGGSLSINPQTGLPEAGFLSSILPMLAGAALTATGVGAPLAALMVGGGTAAMTGSLSKGLMAGLGAYGGAGLGSSLMNAGAAGALPAAAAETAGAVVNPLAGLDVSGVTTAGISPTAAAATPVASQNPLISNALPARGAFNPAQVTSMPGTNFAPSVNPTISGPAGFPGTTTAQPDLSYMTRGMSAVPSSASASTPLTFSENMENMKRGFTGENLMNYAKENPYSTASMVASALTPDEKKPSKPKDDSDMGQRYSYSANEADNPFPNPDPYGREQRYFTPTYTKISNEEAKRIYGYAGGGPIEEMSNANAIGANTGYPMADISKGAYATPYQTPISRNVLSDSADTGVNPMTGQMNFADGGITGQGNLNLQIPLDIGGGGGGGFGQQGANGYQAVGSGDSSGNGFGSGFGSGMLAPAVQPRGQFAGGNNQGLGGLAELFRNLGGRAQSGGNNMGAMGGFGMEQPAAMFNGQHIAYDRQPQMSTLHNIQLTQEQMAEMAKRGESVSSPYARFKEGGSVSSYQDGGVATATPMPDQYSYDPLKQMFNKIESMPSDNQPKPQAPVQTGAGQKPMSDAAFAKQQSEGQKNLQAVQDGTMMTRIGDSLSEGLSFMAQNGPTMALMKAITGGFSGLGAPAGNAAAMNAAGMNGSKSTGTSSGGGSGLSGLSGVSGPGMASTSPGNAVSSAMGGQAAAAAAAAAAGGAAKGGLMAAYAEGGSHLGDYSDGGRLLRGPGDGVSDSIPAMIGKKQPARLADGEFVVPARIVSELGNGSTEAGARKLYAMMDRIQKARGKTVGKGKVAKNSRSEKYLPA